MNHLTSPYYIVAAIRPWNKTTFHSDLVNLPGSWHFASNRTEIESLLHAYPCPRYIFFLHWSERVPDQWLDRYECVCFHMTDVPYGRGGSPLQNLIIRGHKGTKLTALKMVHSMDAGPVYLKEPLSLSGTAEEIFIRASELSAQMIKEIISTHPTPTPQSGEAVVFKRRTPAQSEIPGDLKSLESFNDFVRMLDAPGYPKAFIDYAGFRIEFSHASLDGSKLVTSASITRLPQENEQHQ